MGSNPLHLYSGEASPYLGMGFSTISRKASVSDLPYLSYYERGKKTKTLSFREYFSLVAGLNSLIRDKVKTGDKVIVALGNRIEAFIAYGSLLSLGCTIVPVDPKEGSSYFEEIIRCTGSVFTLDHGVFQVSDLIPETFADFLDHDPASLFFTSGTTGNSKGVTQNFSSLLANLEATKRIAGLTTGDTFFSCLPVFHVNAFNFSFLLPLYLETKIVFSSEYPLTFWKILNDEKVSVASLTPPVIRLINADSRNHAAPESLRFFISASSPIYKEDLQKMKDRFGVRILQAYGLSETVNFTLFNPSDLSDETYEKIHYEAVVPSAGIPTWGNDVQVMDENGKLITEENREGEIVIRGWSVQTGYFANPEATREAFHNEYFHSGDIAFYRMHEGRKFFYITGRKKEVVKRKGKLIYLSEIDGVIKSMGLMEACAVGFSNSYSDEEVGLFLVKDSTTMNSEEILMKLRNTLHPAKCPKVIVVGESIPKTSVGKIKRNGLKDLFLPYQETKFHE
ncbi:MAG: class I adenylate-forming enzyme family protein [Bdellovibrionota bacterium]